MSGAIRGVDELNDYSASTVVPAEPEAGSARAPRLMLCSFCAQALPEIKTMGGFGPCASCGIPEHVAGPVTQDEVATARAYLERMAAIGEGMEQAGLCEHREPMAYCEKCKPVAAGNVAPAGVVRIPGEELLEAIESEEDIVRANRELTEGTEQNRSELGRWQRLYGEVMNECNKRLKPQGVMLLVAVPEPHGLGCVFTGVDAARYEAAKNGGVFSPGGEDYEVVLTLPARQRVDIMATGRENFVRTMIGWVCDATMEQKRAYLARTVH